MTAAYGEMCVPYYMPMPPAREKPPVRSVFDFASDDWFFQEYSPKNNQMPKRIHLLFSAIHFPEVKYLVKQYAAWRLGRVKPVTVRMELGSRIYWWTQYLEHQKICDPYLFGARHFHLFGQWLQRQGVRGAAARRITWSVALLIETGQRLGWRVTEEAVMCHPVRKTQDTGGHAQPIPDEIYRQILRHAICDETDIITKAGILIQSQTGLRISEVLSLKEGCLYTGRRSGIMLGYESKKTQRAEPVTCFTPANTIVCDAVEELGQATRHLRQESGRKELFLIKNHGIRPASAANWNQGRLRTFLKKWNITDGGSEYPLHSHQFRASYVRRKLLAGTGIETVRQQFGHASSEMTAQYVHIQPEELAEVLAPYLDMRGGHGIG